MFIFFINYKIRITTIIEKIIWEILVEKRLFLPKTIQLAYKILEYITCQILSI